MNDMSQVIIVKSDQINADDMISGPITITVREVHIKSGQEQPVSIVFDGSEKVFRPCKTVSKLLVALWGPDANKYIGRSLTLYRDPDVTWAGMKVGGIRVSHMTDIDGARTLALQESKQKKKVFTIKPLVAAADRVAAGVRDLIRLIRDAGADVETVTQDPAVVKQRAWMATNRPELAQQVDEVIALVREANKPASPASATTDDNPFSDQPAAGQPPAGAPDAPLKSDEQAGSDPFEPEGRSDEEMGEAHNDADDPHPATVAANRLIERIKASTDLGLFNKLVNDAKATIQAMPEEMADTVNGVIERRRKLLTKDAANA